MSDGEYEFESVMLGTSGLVRVRNGYFDGENDRFSFSGKFKVHDKILSGEISIRDRETGQEDTPQLFSNIDDDENFSLKLRVQGNEVLVKLRKEKYPPLLR